MAAKNKLGTPKIRRALSFWQGVTLSSLKDIPLDLSTRQSAVLLTVALEEGPHSIKSLAEKLDISKPAICRAVDVLENARLLRRAPDRRDKRNVLITHTAKGAQFLQEFAGLISQASKDAA